MKTVDVGLFEGEPFNIKTAHNGNKEGREYKIEFVPAHIELKLMNEQEAIISKTRSWKNINNNDLEGWKVLLKKVIKENDDTMDEGDVNKLRPMQIIGILMALMEFLNQRSSVIYEALSDDVKVEVEKAKEDIKKKEAAKALSGSEVQS